MRSFSLEQLVSGKLALGWGEHRRKGGQAEVGYLGDELVKLKTLLTGGEDAISKPQGTGT